MSSKTADVMKALGVAYRQSCQQAWFVAFLTVGIISFLFTSSKKTFNCFTFLS